MENGEEIAYVIGMVTIVMTFIAIGIISFVLYFGRKMRLKKISEELQKSRFKEELYRAVMETQENEKLRIARNLHDELKPMLAVIQNKLQIYQYNSENNINKIPDYTDTIALIIQAYEITEKTTHDLIPSFLTHNGLFSTLEFYVKQTSNTSRNVEFNNYLPKECENYFSYNQRLQVYRVVLELLNNIIKHDTPKKVTVNVKLENDTVIFFFTHNGKGIDDTVIKKLKENSEGLGLKSLHGRIELLKGKINYFEKPDVAGIKLAIPI